MKMISNWNESAMHCCIYFLLPLNDKGTQVSLIFAMFTIKLIQSENACIS